MEMVQENAERDEKSVFLPYTSPTLSSDYIPVRSTSYLYTLSMRDKGFITEFVNSKKSFGCSERSKREME